MPEPAIGCCPMAGRRPEAAPHTGENRLRHDPEEYRNNQIQEVRNMHIRNCALENSAFARLLEVYTHREQAGGEFRRKGGRVLAKLGFDVPDEMVIGAGLLPVQIYADPDKPLEKTDTYLEFAFDPTVRQQFEKIVDGTCAAQADFLAISNSTDVVIRVYLYLREMKRIGLEHFPDITFIDWLFTRNRLHQQRNELTLGLFRRQLESWIGHPISDEDIRRGIAVCNEDRAALREMSALRRGQEVRISGCEALVIIGSAFFMERQEHARLVREVTRAAMQWPVLEGPRIFVTGSAQEDTSLYDLIEGAGAVVVGEDHDWGDRFYDRDCNPDYPVIRSLVDRYMLRLFSSKKAFVSQRVQTLMQEVSQTGAQAVLFYNNIYEEAASWDYPSQKKALDEAGKASACFAKMLYPVSRNQGLAEAIGEFVDTLKEDA